MQRGRKPKNIVAAKYCSYCEGIGIHWGKICPACEGSGTSRVQKALDIVYSVKKGGTFRITKSNS